MKNKLGYGFKVWFENEGYFGWLNYSWVMFEIVLRMDKYFVVVLDLIKFLLKYNDFIV